MRGRAGGEINRGIGQRLRLMRTAAKVSQIDLGEALGVTFQQVQKYERGVNRLPATQLHAAAAKLGCSVNDILGGDIRNGTSGEMAEILKMLGTRDGIEMARAFMALSDARRRAVVAMMREFLA